MADCEAAARQRARAATTLTEAKEILASARSVPDFDPATLDVDTRDAMKQVDAGFLEQLCVRNPKIAAARQRTQGSLWLANQTVRDRANYTFKENRLRARSLRVHTDRLERSRRVYEIVAVRGLRQASRPGN